MRTADGHISDASRYQHWGGDRKAQSARVKAYWTPERRLEAKVRARAEYYHWTPERQAQELVREREAMEAEGRAMVAKARGKTEETDMVDRTTPNVEWQWNRLVIREGLIHSQAEVEQLVDVLNYFATKLPPGIKEALDRAKKAKDEAERREAQP